MNYSNFNFLYVHIPFSKRNYRENNVLLNPKKEIILINQENFIFDWKKMGNHPWKAIYLGGGTLSFFNNEIWKQWISFLNFNKLKKTEIIIEINSLEMNKTKWKCLNKSFIKKIIFKEKYVDIKKYPNDFLKQIQYANELNLKVSIDFYDSFQIFNSINLKNLKKIIQNNLVQSISFINWNSFNLLCQKKIKNYFIKNNWKQNRINGFINKNYFSLYDSCFMAENYFYGWGWMAFSWQKEFFFINKGSIEKWKQIQQKTNNEIMFVWKMQQKIFYLNKWDLSKKEINNNWLKLTKILFYEKVFQKKYNLKKHFDYWKCLEKWLGYKII